MSPSLPTEVLVEIFSYTDYLTLKYSIRPACTYFRDIIDHAASRRLDPLRYALFRDILPPPLSVAPTLSLPPTDPAIILYLSGQSAIAPSPIPPLRPQNPSTLKVPYDFHPALSLLRVRPRTGQTDVKPPFGIFNIGFNTPNGFLPIFDSPVASESATSPAAWSVYWKLGKPFNREEASYKNRRWEKAVTVLQLVAGMDSVLEKYVRDGKTVMGNDDDDDDGWSWEREEEGRKLFRSVEVVCWYDDDGRARPLITFSF